MGNGYRHEQPPLQVQPLLCPPDFGHFPRRVTTDIDRKAAATAVEGGELRGAVADDGYAVGFQVFERGGQVEQCFGAGADDDEGSAGELLQVGAYVGARAGPAGAVDAADAAGGEDFDSGAVGDPHGGGDGCGAVELAGDDDGEVAAADFGDLPLGGRGQALDLLRAEAGDEFAFDDANGGGVGAVVADDALHFVGEMEVVGVGEPVGDYGGFESDLGHACSF